MQKLSSFVMDELKEKWTKKSLRLDMHVPLQLILLIKNTLISETHKNTQKVNASYIHSGRTREKLEMAFLTLYISKFSIAFNSFFPLGVG